MIHRYHLFFSLLLIFTSLFLEAQTNWENMILGQEEGLPSQGIYHMVEDHANRMFIATDIGVFVIQGGQVKHYTTENGLGSNSVYRLFKSHNETIWAACHEGGIRFFDTDRWVEPSFNKEVLNNLKSSDFLYDVGFEGQLMFLESYRANDFFHCVDLSDSSVSKLTLENKSSTQRSSPYFLLNKESEIKFMGRITEPSSLELPVNQRFLSNSHKKRNIDTTCLICHEDTIILLGVSPNEGDTLRPTQYRTSYVYLERDSVVLFNNSDWLNVINKDGTYHGVWHFPDAILDVETIDNVVLVATIDHGLYLFDYEPNQGLTPSARHFENETVADIYLDKNGQIWIALLNQGLIRINNIGWRFSTITSGTNLSKPLIFSSDTTAVTLKGPNIVTLKKQSNELPHQWTISSSSLIESINPLTKTFNNISRNDDFFFFKTFSVEIDHPDSVFRNFLGQGPLLAHKYAPIREVYPSKDGSILHLIAGVEAVSYFRQGVADTLKRPSGDVHVSDIIVIGDSIEYAGSNKGILRRERDQLVMAFPNTPEALLPIQKLVKLSQRWNAALVKMKGLVVFSEDSLFLLNSENLLVDNLQTMIASDDSHLYAVSQNNLFIAELNDQGITRYTTYYFDEIPGLRNVEALNVYNGTLHLYEQDNIYSLDVNSIKYGTKESSSFEVSGVWVDGVERDVQKKSLQLYRGEKSVQIQLSSLTVLSYGIPLYKWRIGHDNPWQYSNTGEINLVNLEKGRYNIEIQYRDERGLWNAPVEMLSFQVRSPIVETTWFWLLISSPFAMLLIYLNYISRRRRTLNKELIESNMASLKMQINPHFIFNAFNSIQYLITAKRNETANEYLSRLAKLIRKTISRPDLHRISLEEELNYIREFMAIEQMRLDHSFEFKIAVDPDVSSAESFIPPMILQPILENSVWHGVSKMEQNARIDIHISKKNTVLIIQIMDNGSGFPEQLWDQLLKKEDIEGSLGLRNVLTRLELLSKLYDKKYRLDLNASKVGTHFTLTLPL